MQSNASLKRRRVVISIDDVVSLLRDYCGYDDFPADTMPEKLQLHQTEQGRLCIVAESQHWEHGMPPLEVKFEIRRFHSL